MSPAEACREVVIDPCVIVKEMMDPESRPVLSAWRQGKIRPVVTRRILNHTLGLLRLLGLSRELLELWALWLTHRDRIRVLTLDDTSASSRMEYVNACIQRGSCPLITDRPGDFLGTGRRDPLIVAPADLQGGCST